MNIFTVLIVVVILALIVSLLLIPFRLSLGLFKEGISFEGFYKISYLGFALMKGVIPSPQPVSIEVTDGTQNAQADVMDLKKAEELYSEPVSVSKSEQDLDKVPHPDLHKAPDSKLSGHIRLVVDAFPHIMHILIDFIKSISIERLCCKISFGLDDPVDTAMIDGYLWSIASVLGLYRADISIEPRFEGERFDGSFVAELDARMLWVVVALAKALKEEKTRKLMIKLAKGGMA